MLLARGEVLRALPVVETRARHALPALARLVRESRPLQRFFLANALWEAALGAIRTFVVLWVTIGLGLSLPAASGVIGVAGVFALLGAALAGRLADRFGTRRVIRVTALTYGIPMAVPFLAEESWLLVPFIPIISISAGVMMALPYALLIPMMPRAQHGLLAGFYSMSRGVGIILGPLIAGAAIEAQRAVGSPPGTDGYSALWLVAGILLVTSVPLLADMRREGGGRLDAPRVRRSGSG